MALNKSTLPDKKIALHKLIFRTKSLQDLSHPLSPYPPLALALSAIINTLGGAGEGGRGEGPGAHAPLLSDTL